MDANGNDSGNGSQPDPEYEMRFITSDHLPFVILSIAIVLMNLFVILLFAFHKNLRKPCNFLLVSLSVSDLLTGLVGIPLLLVCSTVADACLPCVFSFSFFVFSSISTVLHILVVSYERFAKIVFPFRFQQIGRRSFELKLVACLWLLSMMLPPIQYIWLPPTPACDAPFTDEQNRKEKIYAISIMIMFVGVPLLLLIYADVSVFFVVRRQLDGIDRNSVGIRDSQRRLKKETRVLALFAIMMLYFVISWSFYYAAVIYHSVAGEEMRIYENAPWLVTLVEVLRLSTPLVNPNLYILLKPDFRRVVSSRVRKFVNKYRSSSKFRSEGSSRQSSNGTPTIYQTDSRNVTEKTAFM